MDEDTGHEGASLSVCSRLLKDLLTEIWGEKMGEAGVHIDGRGEAGVPGPFQMLFPTEPIDLTSEERKEDGGHPLDTPISSKGRDGDGERGE